MLEREPGRRLVVFAAEGDRVSADLFQQAQRGGHSVSGPARVSNEDIADLMYGQAGRAHREVSDRRARQLAVGLAIGRQKPLERDACVDDPSFAGQR